jgi:hypothetical protein
VSLYLINHNETEYYVEAATMPDAIRAWHDADKAEWGNEATADDPQSCQLIYDGPVIRDQRFGLPQPEQGRIA